ncbi:MAG: arginine decarboxylase, pyruvoyl-dependent [Bacillota bacterium]|nr:MAG: arginine decarboxylase, pyruvoyl-dependent [Bacillota bacterium]
MTSLPVPDSYTLVAASAAGQTKLTAFDRALLDAGVGNLNLIRVSSVLPPGAAHRPVLSLPPGALCPIAYGTIASSAPGVTIAAAVAVGIREGSFGMIMEFSGECRKEEAEIAVRAMVDEAFASRGLPLDEVKVRSTEITVPEGKAACAFAGVPLWG